MLRGVKVLGFNAIDVLLEVTRQIMTGRLADLFDLLFNIPKSIVRHQRVGLFERIIFVLNSLMLDLDTMVPRMTLV